MVGDVPGWEKDESGVESLPRDRQEWHSRGPSGVEEIRRAPWRGLRGDRQQWHGQSTAVPVRTTVPPGGYGGEARRSRCSSALPRRRGARTSPGSLAQGGGSPAAAWVMAQPWTTVAWARGPRDRITLPHQRCAGWSAACGAAGYPWDTARARATASATALRHRLAVSHQRGQPRATAQADRGGWDQAGGSACSAGVVRMRWGKRCARAAELVPPVGLEHPAC